MMRLVYNLLLWLFLPLIVVRLAYRGLRNRAYWQRIPERFGFVQRLSDASVIWIHAVSVGEARAAAPLVRALADRYPEARILVTTMTPTGSATVTSLFGDRVAHCYVPYDYPFAVRRFLRRARPRVALIMETELWPNLFRACRARGIPLLVSNARLSEGSMRRYLRVASLARATVQLVNVVAAQSAADARRFEAIGADPARVAVTGSIKFELALPASLFESAQVLRADWGRERPVWIAASTHEGEEEFMLAAFKTLQRRWPTLLLVLVPRHPERFAAVVKLARRDGFNVAQRSQQAAVLDASVEVLIGDTMGELQLFFAAGDVAFVGGSLVATGGHNLLEPAAVGVPTVFGPHMFNFAEIAALTLERRAGRQVGAPGELAEAVAAYLENPNARFEAGEAGRKLVEENRGALERTLKLLAPLLQVS
jgi:3-deoxy-D-manno-octulosonic-acid transferase